jgi:hypothetical protein
MHRLIDLGDGVQVRSELGVFSLPTGKVKGEAFGVTTHT